MWQKAAFGITVHYEIGESNVNSRGESQQAEADLSGRKSFSK